MKMRLVKQIFVKRGTELWQQLDNICWGGQRKLINADINGSYNIISCGKFDYNLLWACGTPKAVTMN
jgi:hypothetical protein